jgi:hypothetical protein
MENKAQAAIEFIILIGFIAFIVGALIAVFGNVIFEEQKEVEQEQIDSFLTYVEEEIQLAKNSPNGYKRTFTLPEEVYGKNYTFFFANDAIAIQWEDKEAAKFLPAYTNGEFCVKPANNIDYRTLSVTKVSNSVINLENCPDCTPTVDTCQTAESLGCSTAPTECCLAYCVCC